MPKKPKTVASSGALLHGVDLPEVERILDFMLKHNLEEFEYERAGVHIRLKKAARTKSEFGSAAGSIPPATLTPSTPDAKAARGAEPPAVLSKEPEDLHLIKSPIVGTFYAAPSPDAEPFAAVGTRVTSGQVLCIIEAMKLMNEIESDVSGELVRSFVENGHPVEYGEPLFGIRLDSKK